jgi:hypothetical protein
MMNSFLGSARKARVVGHRSRKPRVVMLGSHDGEDE